jgi:hypothetical protein
MGSSFTATWLELVEHVGYHRSAEISRLPQ